ncbi:hypothetical protein HZH68_000407 [Vespula germanica]|uniref:Uncharacterized protein n=3 Tax=Vespula TaxID=7451 RepID=A0A834U5Q3_VESGE|nr:hypothetical protein HZH66_000364 [Vespula vulgaris]KAF7417754.1 hypothetical protein HZH68_000407 [Vespula germanica]
MVHHKSQGSLPKVIVGLRNKRAYCSVPSLAGGYCQDEVIRGPQLIEYTTLYNVCLRSIFPSTHQKLKIISASLTTSRGDWFYLNLSKTLMRTFRQ